MPSEHPVETACTMLDVWAVAFRKQAEQYAALYQSTGDEFVRGAAVALNEASESLATSADLIRSGVMVPAPAPLGLRVLEGGDQ